MAARKKKAAKRKGKPAELIISKARVKNAVKKCNVGGEFYGGDPALPAIFQKQWLKGKVGFIQRHEKSVVLFKGLGRNSPQDFVFLDAFACGCRVVNSIAGPAVQQSMMAAGGSG